MSRFIKLLIKIIVILFVRKYISVGLVYNKPTSTEVTENEWSENLSNQLLGSLQNTTENGYSVNTDEYESEDITLFEDHVDKFQFTGLEQNDESHTESTLESLNTKFKGNEEILRQIVRNSLTNVTETTTSVEIGEKVTKTDELGTEPRSTVTDREYDIPTTNEIEFLPPEIEQFYFTEDETEFSSTATDITDQQIENCVTFDQQFEEPEINNLEERTSTETQNINDTLETTKISSNICISSTETILPHSVSGEIEAFNNRQDQKPLYDKGINPLDINMESITSTTITESEPVSDIDDELATEYDETEIPDYGEEEEQTSNEDKSNTITETNNEISTATIRKDNTSTLPTLDLSNTEQLTTKSSSDKATTTSKKGTTHAQLHSTQNRKTGNKAIGKKPATKITTESAFKKKPAKYMKSQKPVAKNITEGVNKNNVSSVDAKNNIVTDKEEEESTNAPINNMPPYTYAEASNITSLNDLHYISFFETTSTIDEQQWLFTGQEKRVGRAKQEASTIPETSTTAITESITYTHNTIIENSGGSTTEEITQSTMTMETNDEFGESNTSLIISYSPPASEETLPLTLPTVKLEEGEDSTSDITGQQKEKVVTEATSTTQIEIKEDALKDIAYYLRAHKFNEYDRRYETKPEDAPRNYYKEFPRPPLRSLHWEVRKFCEPSFFECVDYLSKRVSKVASKRVDDTVVVIQEHKWNRINNSQQINQVNEECKKMRRVDDTIADPFEGPLERFQWRTTASYYMCWYTMQEIPELRHLKENCDNFANCLDMHLGPYNWDERADDDQPFSCARYSFCPDPCCANKHLARWEDCWDSPDNLCFESNPPGERQCSVNGSLNTEFRDLVLNRWNVTCRCPASGREWNSLYGMCVDVDECSTGAHNCDKALEACVNLEGSFRCACKWGHIWDEKKKKCVPSEALHEIKLGRKSQSSAKNESLSFFKKMVRFFKGSNESSMLQPDSLMRTFVVACVLTCTLNEFGLLF